MRGLFLIAIYCIGLAANPAFATSCPELFKTLKADLDAIAITPLDSLLQYWPIARRSRIPPALGLSDASDKDHTRVRMGQSIPGYDDEELTRAIEEVENLSGEVHLDSDTGVLFLPDGRPRLLLAPNERVGVLGHEMQHVRFGVELCNQLISSGVNPKEARQRITDLLSIPKVLEVNEARSVAIELSHPSVAALASMRGMILHGVYPNVEAAFHGVVALKGLYRTPWWQHPFSRPSRESAMEEVRQQAVNAIDKVITLALKYRKFVAIQHLQNSQSGFDSHQAWQKAIEPLVSLGNENLQKLDPDDLKPFEREFYFALVYAMIPNSIGDYMGQKTFDRGSEDQKALISRWFQMRLLKHPQTAGKLLDFQSLSND